MKLLTPYAPLAHVRLRADLQAHGNRLEVRFELEDSERLVKDSLTPGRWENPARAGELWKTTCFEAFFGPRGAKNYWELNLSPSRRSWNVYAFTDYRHPQPPAPALGFTLAEVTATEQTLQARLDCDEALPELEFSLCAVIRTADGVSYFATRHAGAKPDFHLRSSFTVG